MSNFNIVYPIGSQESSLKAQKVDSYRVPLTERLTQKFHNQKEVSEKLSIEENNEDYKSYAKRNECFKIITIPGAVGIVATPLLGLDRYVKT